MKTLQELLGVQVSVIQAPMASVQTSALTVAVASAGALGSLPCALLSADALRKELTTLTSQLGGWPFNVNFFCHAPPQPNPERENGWRQVLAPYYKELGNAPGSIPAGPVLAPFSHETADVLEEFRPAVVSFHFGLPGPELLQRVRAWGAVVLSSATTVEEARWLEARGADVIVAQGLEAGGHRGHFLSTDLTRQMGTFALLPQIVRHVKVPVVAAGGIADSHGVAAAMALGAAGVQVGTAYLLCPEVTTSPIHRAAIKSDLSHHTALTNVFTGGGARCIMNRITRELGPMNPLVPGFPLAAAAMAPLRAKAEAAGAGDFSPLWCGQNSTGCSEIPAADLTRRLNPD